MAAAAIASPTSSAPGGVAPAVNSASRKRRQNPGGDNPATAQKVAKATEAAPEASLVIPSPLGPEPVVTVFKAPGARRPQMKYDPSVPMSKEATSVWRREQRRKRNRESAAACRRRQRDRISELEGEAAGWRAKFEEALGRLAELEGEESRRELEERIVTTMPIVRKPEVNPTDGQQPKIETVVVRCGTPPAVTSSSQASNMDASRVVSPCDRLKVPPAVTSAMDPSLTRDELEDLAFPVLEDAVLPEAIVSGPLKSQLKAQFKVQVKAQLRAKQGFQTNKRRKRGGILQGGHLSENITPARPRLIDFYTRPGRQERWTDGIGHSLSSQ